MGFQAAKCPECGADIQVPANRANAKCMFCGKDILLKTATADPDQKRVENWMRLAKAADDASNHEESYAYFTKVLEVEPKNFLAWFGKARAAGWQSRLNNHRFREMVVGLESSFACAPKNALNELHSRAADLIARVALSYVELSAEHTREFLSVDSSWPEHVERCSAVLTALTTAAAWSPKDDAVLEVTLTVIDSLLTGMEEVDPRDGATYYHVPDHIKSKLEAQRAEVIAKIQALNPSFQVPTVTPVAGPGCGCYLALIAGALLLGFAVLVGLGLVMRH